MNSNKPNILMLMADQLTANALSAYGNKISKTPNIDYLARQGVVFESAYCNSPLCAPSRAAMMTGRLVSNNKVFDNAAELSADQPTLAHYLRRDGYQTILAGKMHFCGPDQLHGFEQRLTTDIYPADFGWTPDWRHPEVRLDWYHNMSSVTDAGSCVRTNQLDFDDEVVFATRQKLFDLARQPQRQPFFLLMSLTHPHDPFAMPERYLQRFALEEVDLPTVPAAPEGEDAHSRRIRAMCQMASDGYSPEQVRRARQAYYAALSYVDDQFGIVLDTLRETGLDNDTIVVVLSDHGEMLGERGLWYKMHFFEGALRVPLIISAPQRLPATRVTTPVSLVDLLPTLHELSGATTPVATPLDGRSVLPLIEGPLHDPHVPLVKAEYLAEGALDPIVMLRRGDYKFVYSRQDGALLFNLVEDPSELINLAVDPAREPEVEQWLSEVHQHWDLQQLEQEVLASQSRRQLVYGALSQGQRQSWDHQPGRDASQQYIRNTQTLDEQEAYARYPRVSMSNPNQTHANPFKERHDA